MSKKMITDLSEGDRIQSYFLVREKGKHMTRTGKPYLNIDLIDRSGQINARVWDNAEELFQTFEKGDIVKVLGSVDSYQGKTQLKVTDIRAVDPDHDEGLDMADILPRTPCDIDELWRELIDIAGSVQDADLKRLLETIFSDKKTAEAFMRATAARDMHHNYIGGLLEHTVSVAKLGDLLCGHYGDGIDRDMVITGALLHDIGKIDEINADGDFNYTVEGSLKGHIVIGIQIVSVFASRLEDFPPEKKVLLDHLIISHQGQKEWSSPIEPKTPEAQILHIADLTDARVFQMLRAINNDDNAADPFTNKVIALGRSVLKVRDADSLKKWVSDKQGR